MSGRSASSLVRCLAVASGLVTLVVPLAGGAAQQEVAAEPEADEIVGRPTSWGGEGAGGAKLAVEAGTRLLQQPSATAPVVEVVPEAMELDVLERLGGWVRLRYAGYAGWVLVDADGSLQGAALPRMRQQVRGDEERLARLAARFEGRPLRRLGGYPLWTDVEDEAILERLTALAKGLEAVWPRVLGLEAGAPSATTFVLFAREEGYVALRHDERAAAGTDGSTFRIESARCCDLLLTATFIGDADAATFDQVALHQLVHLQSRRTFGRELPPWLEEGLADAFAFASLTDGGEVDFRRLGGAEEVIHGIPRASHPTLVRVTGAGASLRDLLDGWSGPGRLPVDRLISATPAEVDRLPDFGLFQAESAYLVRYLLLGPERTGERFRAYLRRLAASEAPPPAAGLFDALETSPRALETGFFRWLRNRARAEGLVVGR